MRLNRYLAACGLGSRRGCETLVLDGRVSINGSLCQDLTRQIREGDQVKVDGRAFKPAPPQTIALFKPRGFVTTRKDELSRSTVYKILPEHFIDLHHVGRLDLDSEGLLILTRDGALAQQLTRPSAGIEKEYLITLDRSFDHQQHGSQLTEGIVLEEGRATAVSYLHLSPRRLQVVLKQGMKRQLRRMFAEMGYRIKKLVRVRIGCLPIGDLKPGRWRTLGDDEIQLLLRNLNRPAPTEKKKENPTVSRKRREKRTKISKDNHWRKAMPRKRVGGRKK